MDVSHARTESRKHLRVRVSKHAERVLVIVGISLLGIFAIAYVWGYIGSRSAVSDFRERISSSDDPAAQTSTAAPTDVDFSLWSEKRIEEYRASLGSYRHEPIGILRITKINLEVPVFNGTDDLTLNRGVGRIIGTAQPGSSGNLGIAGHRDGFFRGLKDVAIGDDMLLETRTEVQKYTIDKISIVDPNDVSVLKNEASPAITLVTCYPFYFIGSAPQRYIVRASLAAIQSPRSSSAVVKASLNPDVNTKENKK